MNHPEYRIAWSYEDEEYVAMTPDYPSLSWLDKDPNAAIAGLQHLIAEIEADGQPHTPVDPMQELRDRYAQLAKRIPPGQRQGEEMFFLEELERGEALRIEAERLMKAPLEREEWVRIFQHVREMEGREDISPNDFIQAIIAARHTTFERARQALYRLFEQDAIALNRLNRLEIVEDEPAPPTKPTPTTSATH